MTTADVSLCEHGEIPAACLDCFGQPKKLAPQARVTRRTTKTPASGTDTIAPFGGTLDMSLPVDDPADHIGETSLPARIFPHHLRRGGWVYLRSSSALEGRVKAKRMVWCDDLSGMKLEVDVETWDSTIELPLGRLAAQQRTGYRYLWANDDGTVTHYMGGKPIVEIDDDADD